MKKPKIVKKLSIEQIKAKKQELITVGQTYVRLFLENGGTISHMQANRASFARVAARQHLNVTYPLAAIDLCGTLLVTDYIEDGLKSALVEKGNI